MNIAVTEQASPVQSNLLTAESFFRSILVCDTLSVNTTCDLEDTSLRLVAEKGENKHAQGGDLK